MLARQLTAELLAHSVNLMAENGAVRAGEVDEFEDAGGRSHLPEGMKGLQPVLVDDDHLPRFDFANEFGLDQVEGAGLGGDDIGAVELPEHQRAETVGVAHGDHAGFGEKDQTVGALDDLQGFGDPVGQGIGLGAGEQMDDRLGIGGGRKDRTLLFQAVARFLGIDQIAVVGHGDTAAVHNRP